MKKTVLTFGLISGAIMSLMLIVALPFHDDMGYGTAEIVGYTTIVAAGLLIFFGIRSYRDNKAGRTISFGRAFIVGLLINVVASAIYTATWQVVYYNFAPDYGARYGEHIIEKERAKGASEAEITEKQAEVAKFQEMYKNPFFNIAITFLEAFPVGLVLSALSAAILRQRRSRPLGGAEFS